MRRRLALVVAALALPLAGLVVLDVAGLRARGGVKVDVPANATVGALGPALARAGAIRLAPLWGAYAALTGRADAPVRAGRHLVRRGEGWGTLAAQLADGSRRLARVTVPEGWTVPMVVAALADSLGLPRDALLAAARDGAARARMRTGAPDLEGYLFPATYEFLPRTGAREALDSMLVAFDRRWDDAWDAELARRGWTRQQAVTLASIVEREAKVASERPRIAAVYRNRLAKGMRLQADPTVLYALGVFAKRVTFDDLRIASPYNTYRTAGLPPGPIANPGRAALAAAVRPAPDDTSLYFVAFPDGHHEFHAGFAAHRDAIARARRAAGR